VRIFLSAKLQVDFVNQGRRLKSMPGALALEMVVGETPQVRIDDGNEFLTRAGVAKIPLPQ
jgi:hypothetical protein